MKTENQKIFSKYNTFHQLLKEYICDGSIDTMRGLAENGADSGYTLLCYNSDIKEVVDIYGFDVEGVVADYCDAIGSTMAQVFADYCTRKHVFGTIAEWNAWLVWCAAELICQDATNEVDSDQLGE